MILDLANNRLNGSIPSCLTNMSFGRSGYTHGYGHTTSVGYTYESGLESYFKSRLRLPREFEPDYFSHLNFIFDFVSKNRVASRKSKTYFKRIRYLPDLMGDSLDLGSYSRRVFVDVGNGEGSSGTEWFIQNYPTRNQNFDMYKIETVNDEMSLDSEKTGMTEWLNGNVKEDEYVVMKAEAEVVEEIMKSKSIKMVDELFLECKPNGLGLSLRGRKMQSKSGRAYWECLALYGKLRDEGVAVHQWWG